MTKEKLYKIIVSVGILIISFLPKIDKELYVLSTGNIGYFDSGLAIIMIVGLFLNWKYIKEIVLVLFAMRTILPIAYLTPFIAGYSFSEIRIGFIIEFIVLPIGIFSIIQLRKIERKIHTTT
ncbi:hypothetical protein [Sunxiuqinia indica]|uniref:hypothetical protein n=1 Tax=Sunxiuqinia indica TaxID=2692584 RepID=UPI0013584379|nr:hypothetical protein [Sunxiuqinia indica]